MLIVLSPILSKIALKVNLPVESSSVIFRSAWGVVTSTLAPGSVVAVTFMIFWSVVP